MRTLFISSVVLALAVISCNGLPQGGAAPTGQHANANAVARPQGARPRQQNMSTRLRSMISGAMGDMSGVYDRVRNGFTRTFSGGASRPNGFRNVNGGAPRTPVDPAIHTNEIAPARNSEGAPNAPAQGFRRPAGGRRPNNFMKRVEQIVGNMRNMFQNFNRRMSGAGNTRRTQPQFQQPQQAGQHQPQAAEHHQTGEFRPLQ